MKEASVAIEGDISDAIVNETPVESLTESIQQEYTEEQALQDEPIDQEESILEEPVEDSVVDAYADPTSPISAQPSPVNPTDPVPGFQVVQATGLTDTSPPAIVKSRLPESATPSPIVPSISPPLPPMDRFGSPPPPPPKSPASPINDPLADMPQSKVFARRLDVCLFLKKVSFSIVHDQRVLFECVSTKDS